MQETDTEERSRLLTKVNIQPSKKELEIGKNTLVCFRGLKNLCFNLHLTSCMDCCTPYLLPALAVDLAVVSHFSHCIKTLVRCMILLACLLLIGIYAAIADLRSVDQNVLKRCHENDRGVQQGLEKMAANNEQGAYRSCQGDQALSGVCD